MEKCRALSYINGAISLTQLLTMFHRCSVGNFIVSIMS